MSDKSILVVLVSLVTALFIVLATSPMLPLDTGGSTSTLATTKPMESRSMRTPTSNEPEPVLEKLSSDKPVVFNSYDQLISYLRNRLSMKESTDKVSEETASWSERVVVPLARTYTGTAGGEEVGTYAETRYSETNVQVIGVDEPDRVKTNGRVLVVAKYDSVYVIDLSVDNVSSIIRVDGGVYGLFLANNTLIILFTGEIYRPLTLPYGGSSTSYYINSTIHLYDITNPYQPVEIGNISLTGFITGARLTNNTLYVVSRLEIIEPIIPCVDNARIPVNHILLLSDEPGYYVIILALNLDTMKYSSYAFIMSPTSWMYMSHHRLYLASLETYYYPEIEFIGLKTIAKHLPLDIRNTIYSYLNEKDIYDAYRVVREYLSKMSREYIEEFIANVTRELKNYTFTENTTFYVFRVYYTNVSYIGEFKVEGRVLDQFSMEEMKSKYFVVATTKQTYSIYVDIYIPEIPEPGEEHGEISIVQCRGSECYTTVLTVTKPPREHYYETSIWLWIVRRSLYEPVSNVYVVDVKTLDTVGVLTNIAPGERIYSSRLIGNIFYLVTFRRIDPLFAINLTDPRNPEIIGFIEAPGFSEYLHPLPGKLLLGIGREDWYLKISLYDISDPTRIVEVSKVKIKHATSPALYDHHAVTFDYEMERIYVPIHIWIDGGSGVLVLTYTSGNLTVLKLLENPYATRTVYAGEKIYTISYDAVVVYDINTLEYLKTIQLIGGEEPYIYRW